MKPHSILAFAIGTAPHEISRQLIRFTYNMGDFEDWIEEVALCTNHEARKRGLDHREDKPEPSGESDCYDFIEIMSDEQLQQQQTWIALVCSVI